LTLHNRAIFLAAALILAPLGARAADLVIWWGRGFSPQENEALQEVVAAFEQRSGKQVEIVFYPQPELPDRIEEALAAGQPPNIAFGTWLPEYVGQWAFDDRLVELSGTLGALSDLFDRDALDRLRMLDHKTGQKGLYGLPVGRISNFLHVWKSTLELAGVKIEDIPKEWDAFWAFWCDRVQPAVRKATGRADTVDQFAQFVVAYEADYVTPDGRLVLDDPEIRQKLVRALDSYTAIYRKGCTPPDSVTWASGHDNNREFLTQAVVMTPNVSLSIPNELKHERPEDYYKNTATIEWPLGPSGKPFPIVGLILPMVVFKHGDVETAEEFIHFLVAEGWLAHYLNFSGERFLPPMSKLLDQPFWLDPRDRHLMAAVMQVRSRPLAHNYAIASGDLGHDQVVKERVWAQAIHRVAADGISPEQAVDEAIARIKQILAQ
jgi:multiple sugar transport system substrate-binding protein